MDASTAVAPTTGGRAHPGRLLESVGGVAASCVAIYELSGVLSQGLRFLGRFAHSSLTLLILVAAWTLAVCVAALFVWRRTARRGRNASRRWAPLLSRVLILVVLAATLTGGFLVGFSVLRFDVVHAQPVQAGQLGVAVAQMGDGLDYASTARGKEITAYIARNLRRSLDGMPEVGDSVTVVSAPLVKTEAEALAAARRMGVRLIIWGWVSAAPDEVLSPEFTFSSESDLPYGLPDVPEWHTVEVSGAGSLELGRMVAGRSSGLVAYVLGLIRLAKQDFVGAAEGFDEAIQLLEASVPAQKGGASEEAALHRTLAIYHLAAGRSLAAAGKGAEARAEYEAAIGLDPSFGPSYIGLGNIEYSERRCVEAEAQYRKAATLADTKARAWYSIGNAAFCEDRIAVAIMAYQNAIELTPKGDPSLPLYHLARGVSLCRLGQGAEGLAEIETARGLADPGSSLIDAAVAEAQDCTGAVATPEPAGSAPPAPVRTLTPTPTARRGAGTSVGGPTRAATATGSPRATATPTATGGSGRSATPAPPSPTASRTATLAPGTDAPPPYLPSTTIPPSATNSPRPSATNTRQPPTDTPVTPTKTPRPTATNTQRPPTRTATLWPTAVPSAPRPKGTP